MSINRLVCRQKEQVRTGKLSEPVGRLIQLGMSGLLGRPVGRPINLVSHVDLRS